MPDLFVSDLDGTLIDSSKQVSERTRQAIANWRRAGNKFIIATGRLLSSVEYFSDMLTPDDYLVCCSGAVIYRKKQVIFERTVPSHVIKRLWDLMEQTNGYCQVYRGRDLIANKRASVALTYEKVSAALPQGYHIPISYQPSYQDWLGVGVHKLSFTFDTDEEAQAILKALDLGSEKVNSFRSLSFLYDIVSNEANKGIATEFLRSQLQPERVFVAGDNENDVDMFLMFENNYVVETAPLHVKQLAANVIASPKEQGLGDLLDSLLRDKD